MKNWTLLRTHTKFVCKKWYLHQDHGQMCGRERIHFLCTTSLVEIPISTRPCICPLDDIMQYLIYCMHLIKLWLMTTAIFATCSSIMTMMIEHRQLFFRNPLMSLTISYERKHFLQIILEKINRLSWKRLE